jgi:hypothetical protein
MCRIYGLGLLYTLQFFILGLEMIELRHDYL